MNDCFGSSFSTGQPEASSWLSLGFEDLVRSIRSDPAKPADGSAAKPFDVLIVGSGYGGAMAAAELAGAEEVVNGVSRKITVCVLERGREYLPGSFPGSVDELAGHVRFSTPGSPAPRGRLEGLFDLRLGPDVNALVANGLGGGSLINAGVMLRPAPQVLAAGLPPDLAQFFDATEEALGVKNSQYSDANAPQKAFALRRLSPGNHGFVPISVGVSAGVTSAQVRLEECVKCGDCATGCNFGAKNSLDVNLLVKAAAAGAQIFTGATVLRLERRPRPATDGWMVHAVPTDRTMRERHGEPLAIHARKLILAAGTFGSTEILMRSRSETLRFSQMLGQRFSSNGDMLAAVYDHHETANAVADEGVNPCERKVGPTITSMLDLRGTDGFAIQEMAIPGPLRRAFEETATTAWTLHELAEPDTEEHTGTETGYDPCAVNPERIGRSTIIAMMGDDGAAGAMELAGGSDEKHGDGAIGVRWPELPLGKPGTAGGSVFDREMEVLERLVEGSGAGGTALPNPLWRLLPASMSFLMDDARGPAMTVHPLGGCSLGKDRDGAVVNHDGQVFDADKHSNVEVFGDLVVLDGSIVPRALGINPALTIAALALRASRSLREKWQFEPPVQAPLPARHRPIFQRKRYEAKPKPTFAFAERLSGTADVRLPGETRARAKFVELTVHYLPSELGPLMSKMPRALTVDGNASKLRVFEDRATYERARVFDPRVPKLEDRLDRAALPGSIAGLQGTLKFLHREPSTAWDRRWRALWGYIWNRGLRDLADSLRKGKPGNGQSIGDLIESAWNLASRAGEARLFEYDLVAQPTGGVPFGIKGRKRFTYEFRANLWQQLESLTLTEFNKKKASGTVEIDFKYFAEIRTPLARILTQPNMPASLVELGAFFGYLARLLINIHMWSFRRPDAPRPRVPQRLPGVIERSLPHTAPNPPQFIEIEVGTLPIGYPVKVRLTRYPRFDSKAPPVMLIHGYSASGTTFAHTAVRPNLVERLWQEGRDVWVIDMRTSAGFLTAAWPWSFEDPALVDIPAAVDRILRETKQPKLDVVAHCMGAAMFSMALLKAPEPGDPYYNERAALPDRIRRVVLSQVGPLVEFSPINVFRGYVMRYMRHYLGISAFDFRISDAPSVAEQLMDRFLSSLRYPLEELEIENPLNPFANTEFVGTRHRIDSLYGRSFSLANLSREVLDNIDDFFGPLNLATVSQALFFSQEHVITNRNGRNVFLDRKSRDGRWKPEIATLTLHGRQNGLVDKATQGRIDAYFNREDDGIRPLPVPRFKQLAFEDLGHQDALIGKEEFTRPVFDAIVQFLEAEDVEAGTLAAVPGWLVRVPGIGPHRSVSRSGATTVTIAAAAEPKLGNPALAVVVTVKIVDGRFVEFPVPSGIGPASSQYLFEVKPDKDGWLSIAVPNALLSSPAEGLLMLLLYDQPASMAEGLPGFGDFVSNLRQINALREVAVPADLGPVLQMMGAADGAPWLPMLNALLALFQELVAVFADIRKEVSKALEQPVAVLEPGYFPTPIRETQGQVPCTRVFVGSCQYPQGLLDAAPAWAGYTKLKSELGADAGDSLLLLLGDQIYSDATAGIFDPFFLDDRFRRPHDALFSRSGVRSVLKRVPTVMMLDDHEIRDNWEPIADDPRPRESLKEGLAAYKDFQRRAGPDPEAPSGDSPDPLWVAFTQAGLPFFVADTRTERRLRRAEAWDQSRIMSDTQCERLLAWLREAGKDDRHVPKFIACPAMLLPRRRETQRQVTVGPSARNAEAGPMRSDAWDGYPRSMRTLLHEIVKRDIPNVIFLSGDEHLFCRATVELHGYGNTQTVHSIHSSPLYAPYPFANSMQAEFLDSTDRFKLLAADPAEPEIVDCEVESGFETFKSGFAEIRVCKGTVGWSVEVRFHDAAGNSASKWYRLALTNAAGGNAPHGAADVVGDEQRALPVDGHADGPAERLEPVVDETGEDIDR